jgi:hypothetical protein
MILAGLTTTNAGSSASDTYLGPFLTTASTTPESSVQMVVPVAGSVSNLAVNIGTAPGGGKSWTFTIRKNGNDTAVTCSMIGGGSNTSCNSAESVAFGVGDLLSLEVHPVGGPANWGSARWSVKLTGS